MMQQELLMPTWPNYNFTYIPLDERVLFYDQEMDLCVVDDINCDLSYSFTSPDHESSNSYAPAMITDEFFDLKDSCNEIQIEGTLDTISKGDIEGICEWINEEDSSSHDDLTMEGDGWSPAFLASDSNHNSLPTEADEEMTLVHLLRAYGEAVERGEKELGEVIKNSIKNKSSPLGNAPRRVAYNLFESGELLQDEESCKSLAAAFRVLYQSLPNGRLAHFAANSAIVDSIPHDARVVQIVDFDMGEGIQWPPLMEALGSKGKAMMITSIRPEAPSCWEFEATKKKLLSHAKHCGVRLQIEEKSLEEVVIEMMTTKRSEWVAFNCMAALPHMGRRRPRASVEGFLNQAKALITSYGGVLVLGDGEARDSFDISCSYASFFDTMQMHYQAVFESLERSLPVYLNEARAAMESLFLAPLMCPVAWLQDWEETRRGRDFESETQLKGRKVGLESLIEAKEMVVEGEGSYSVKVEEMREHEMVLRWNETPLVRVSTWM